MRWPLITFFQCIDWHVSNKQCVSVIDPSQFDKVDGIEATVHRNNAKYHES